MIMLKFRLLHKIILAFLKDAKNITQIYVVNKMDLEPFHSFGFWAMYMIPTRF